MNNRYFGNIHDFCKYGLLRCLARHGFRLGVCWMWTPGSGKPEGRGYEYLDAGPDIPNLYRLRECDRGLFDWLFQQRPRFQRGEVAEWGVGMMAASGVAGGIIPEAAYFGREMPRAFAGRDEYFNDMIHRFNHEQGLNRKNIVFLDPDLGMGFNPREFSGKRGSGYLRAEEVAKCVDAGFSVLFYHDWHRDWGQHFDVEKEVRGALRGKGVDAPIWTLEADAPFPGERLESGEIRARFFLVQRGKHSAKIGGFFESLRGSGWCKRKVFSVRPQRVVVFVDAENVASFGEEGFLDCAFGALESLGNLQIVAAGNKSDSQENIREHLRGRGADIIDVQPGAKHEAEYKLSAAAIEKTERQELDIVVVVSNDRMFRFDAKRARKSGVRYIGVGYRKTGQQPNKDYYKQCREFMTVEPGDSGLEVKWK